MQRWPRRAPKVDDSTVGITFVDVLFALVIAEVLTPLRNVDAIPSAGWAHLTVAVVLTLTSWIGYHNSVNRPRYLIRFPNLPLAQFLLDIAMVVTYWMAAVTMELTTNGRLPDARSETRAVAVSFALYAAWDGVGLLIRKDERYRRRPLGKDIRQRRHVTWWFCLGSAGMWAATEVTAPDRAAIVVAIDAVLVLVLFGFRFAKEFVTKDDPFEPDERSAVGATT